MTTRVFRQAMASSTPHLLTLRASEALKNRGSQSKPSSVASPHYISKVSGLGQLTVLSSLIMLAMEQRGSESNMNLGTIQIGTAIGVLLTLAVGIAISFSMRKHRPRRPRVDYGGP